MSITVIPAARAGDQVAAQSDGEPYCYTQACSFSQVAGRDWIAGVVYTAEGIDPTEAIDQLVSAIAPRAAAQPHDVVAPSVGALADCAALAADIDLPSLLGVAGASFSAGNGPAEAGPGVYGAMAAAAQASCMTDSASPHIEVQVLPDAGWLLDEMPPAGSSVVATGEGLRILSWADGGGQRPVVFAAFDGALVQVASNQVSVETLIAIAQNVLDVV